MYIGDFPFTEHDGSLMSSQYGMKINVGQQFHYSPCNLLVREGDSHKLFVTDPSKDISNLHKIDVTNASPDLHYCTQLKYLHYIARSTIQSTLQKERHSECRSNPEHDQIFPIGHNRFYRNLGDLSITFACTPVTAIPRIQEKCFKRVPVVVHGKSAFIDPYMKIVHQHASETPCVLRLPPAIRSHEGHYLTYLPQKTILKPFDVPQTPPKNHPPKASMRSWWLSICD